MVIPNAVAPRQPVRQPGPEEPVTVLYLGDISDDKGVFILLDAWQQLEFSAEGTCAQLLLAGGGAVERARARTLDLGLQDHARVLGWVPPEEVEALLRQSQVLVLPSRYEGQPMAVLEAMANGLCVVVTDVGGLPDMVDPNCGILIPADDVQALAASLQYVVTNHQERSRLGLQALRRVKEKFDIDVTWRSFDKLYVQMQR